MDKASAAQVTETKLVMSAPTLLGYGPIECTDVAPNNIYGLVADLADGSRHLLVRSGRQIPGFCQIASFSQQALIQDGWFFVIANNSEGVTALLRGQLPDEEPRLKAGAFVPTSDGTVRFMVENLTHGQSSRGALSHRRTGEIVKLHS